MAVTSIATSHGMTEEKWKKGLFKKYQENTFFGKFKGMGSNSIIQVSQELSKGAGDAITFGFSNSIRGTAGVTGNTPLEGHDGTNYVTNNEAMTINDQRVVIDQLRQSIKLAGIMDEKRTAVNLRNEAKSQLTDWLAYNEDQALFSVINSADAVLGSVITGTGLTYDAIVDMKKEAMFPTTNNIGASKTTRKIEPIKVEDGEEMFVLGVNPADAASFRKSTDFKDFNKYADVRGSKNSIFTGALGVFNNVVVHEHSGFAAGSPVLMGATAGLLAFGKEIIYGEDEFDFKNQTGFMIGSIRGTALAKHNGTDDNASGSSYGAIKFDLTA